MTRHHTCHEGMNPPFPGPCAACEVETECDRLTRERDEARARLSSVETTLSIRYALRREIETLLGIDPGAASDEALQAGVDAVKGLMAERDRLKALLEKARVGLIESASNPEYGYSILPEIDAALEESQP